MRTLRQNSPQPVRTDPKVLRQAISRASATLQEAGVETARVDAELLACHVLGITRGELAVALVAGRDLSFDLERYDQLVGDRAQRIPLQHLTGTAACRSEEHTSELQSRG